MSLNWIRAPGAATKVSAGGNNVWCVNRSQEIFRYEGGNWQKMPGAAVGVSVAADGTCVVVNKDDQIWKWNQYSNNWDSMPGLLRVCSVGSAQHIWGCNAQQEIFYWAGGNWTKVDGACVNISVGADGTVWCCNRNDEVFRRNGPHGQWEKVEGALTCVSVADAHTVIGNNRSGQIYKWVGHSWEQQPGATVHISVGEGQHRHVWGVNSSEELYTHRS